MVIGIRQLWLPNNEHNRYLKALSIIGRTLVHYYKFLLIKMHITEKDRYTLIEQSENNHTADCSIRVYLSFCDMHFDKQGFRVCASTTYCFQKTWELSYKY